MNTFTTRGQRMAQRAFACAEARSGNKEYASLAKAYPALIQAAGLCQAVAFAQAKRPELLDDLAMTMGPGSVANRETLARRSREAPLMEYLRLTRLALEAAVWIKRYVEALEKSAPRSSTAAPEGAEAENLS
jgi:CRISPR-associated protein Cmr5